MNLETLRQYLRHTSWPVIMAMVLLMAVGIVAIEVYEEAQDSAGMARKQGVFVIVGLVGFILATLVPYQKLGGYAYLLFAITLLFLLVIFFLPATRGAHRWIDLRIFKVQPSEVAKLTFIILLAWYLRYGDHYRTLSGLVPPFVLAFVPMGLILIEPDLGTSLLFLPTLYFMLFMAGARLRHLLGIMAVATVLVLLPVPRAITAEMRAAEAVDRESLCYVTVGSGPRRYVVAPALVAMMEAHQLRRVDGWLRQTDPEVAGDKGYQLRQSKTILANGSWAGGGGWNEANQFFRTLPDGHTDFIFAVIGGQWGLLGCLVVLLLYAAIILCGIEIAVITYDPFGRLLAVGVLGLLLSQLVINVSMTVGLMPITGMTLPLVSYGGSSLVVNCVALGILVNVGQRRPVLLSPKPFEHGDREGPDALFGPMSTGEPETKPRGWRGR